MTLIEPSDLAASLPGLSPERASELCADANAEALLAAPCLATLTDATKLASAKAILRRAIRYEVESGGSVQTQTTGPHSVTVAPSARRAPRLLAPLQVADLRALCSAPAVLPQAYSVPLGRPS